MSNLLNLNKAFDKYTGDEVVKRFLFHVQVVYLQIWHAMVLLFYWKPKIIISNFKSKGFKKFLREDILGSNDTPRKKALSVALGIVVGFTPFYGFQSIIVLSLASIFKLNRAIALATSYISIPPLIPFIVYASLKTGYWVLGNHAPLTLDAIFNKVDIWEQIEFYLLGSLVLCVVLGVFFGMLTYTWLTYLNKRKTT
ncbi:DUF2062 domain-containing protein [Neptunitalea chrysea]|nr:DUF2062 domain-containing protein [Neptunitalea chrysea]